jgi:hypothetical protein
MSKAVQPVAVNGIEFDALIDSNEEYASEIPDYPTEDGFMIHDTITNQSPTLSMTLFVSTAPVTWKSRFRNASMRPQEVKEQLKQTWSNRELVTVVTTDETYENMGITNISFSKSVAVGYAYQIPISFKQVRVTQNKTVSIPSGYGKSGKTGTSAGNANTSSGTSSQGKSEAYQKGFALFAGSGLSSF